MYIGILYNYFCAFMCILTIDFFKNFVYNLSIKLKGWYFMDAIMTAVSTVGFPIAISCYLLYTQTKYMQAIKSALDNNTKAITDLSNKLERVDN